MSESGQPPERVDRVKRGAKDKGADEKIGRALGKAFGRLKRTRVWKDTARAYKDGLEGKDGPPGKEGLPGTDGR